MIKVLMLKKHYLLYISCRELKRRNSYPLNFGGHPSSSSMVEMKHITMKQIKQVYEARVMEVMMDKNKISKLLWILRVGFMIAAILFLLATMLGEENYNWLIHSALFCTLLLNVLNMLFYHLNKRK